MFSEGLSTTPRLSGRRVCIAYDCIYPLTRGGAEKWYRALSDHLVTEGADITYLTRRQWTNTSPTEAHLDVIAVSGASELYGPSGSRRILPAIRYGIGVGWWLARHRRVVDVVHLSSFPFFSFLFARLALVGSGTPIFVDFIEVWSADYWRSYLGRLAGACGDLVERVVIILSQHGFVFVTENARRLRQRGFRGELTVLPGLVPDANLGGDAELSPSKDPVVLFVGRLVRDKGVLDLADIVAAARKEVPTLRACVVGDGPERKDAEAVVAERGLSHVIHFVGRVDDDELARLYATSGCTIVPSYREGYGIVAVESTAWGTPVVVVSHPENLAVDIVSQGINGVVTAPDARSAAQGIATVLRGGADLRRSTREWYESQGVGRTMKDSAAAVASTYLKTWSR